MAGALSELIKQLRPNESSSIGFAVSSSPHPAVPPVVRRSESRVARHRSLLPIQRPLLKMWKLSPERGPEAFTRLQVARICARRSPSPAHTASGSGVTSVLHPLLVRREPNPPPKHIHKKFGEKKIKSSNEEKKRPPKDPLYESRFLFFWQTPHLPPATPGILPCCPNLRRAEVSVRLLGLYGK